MENSSGHCALPCTLRETVGYSTDDSHFFLLAETRSDRMPTLKKLTNITHCLTVHRSHNTILIPKAVASTNGRFKISESTWGDTLFAIQDTISPFCRHLRQKNAPPNRWLQSKPISSRKPFSIAGSIKCIWMTCLFGEWWEKCSPRRTSLV